LNDSHQGAPKNIYQSLENRWSGSNSKEGKNMKWLWGHLGSAFLDPLDDAKSS